MLSSCYHIVLISMSSFYHCHNIIITIFLTLFQSSLKRMYAMTPSLCKSISTSTEKGGSKPSMSQLSRKLNSSLETQSNSKKRNFTEAFEMSSTSPPAMSSSFIIGSMKKQKTLDAFGLTKSSLSSLSSGNINHNCGDGIIIKDKADNVLIANHQENNDSDNNVNINNSLTTDIISDRINKFVTNINTRNCHGDETISSYKDQNHTSKISSSSLDDPSVNDPSKKTKNISSSSSIDKPSSSSSSSVKRYSFPSGKTPITNERIAKKERTFQVIKVFL